VEAAVGIVLRRQATLLTAAVVLAVIGMAFGAVVLYRNLRLKKAVKRFDKI
jgi:predicted tellurium resistance membrane protein TerC